MVLNHFMRGNSPGAVFTVHHWPRYVGGVAVCVAIALWLALPDQAATHRELPLLPFVFGLLLLTVSRLTRMGLSPSILISFGLMTVRYVVMPAITVATGSYAAVGTMQATPDEMHQAYGLMIYEMIGVVAVIAWVGPQWLAHGEPEPAPTLVPFPRSIVLPGLVAVGCLVVLLFPAVAANYRLFTHSVGSYDLDLLTRSGGSGYLILLVEWGRLAVCLWALNAVWSAYKRKPRWYWVLLSIGCLLPLLLFSNRSSRNSILFPALAGGLLLMRMYPRWKKIMGIFLSALLLTTVGIISYQKNFGDQLLDSGMQGGDQLPRFLQAYAAPAHGVAIAIETRNRFAEYSTGKQAAWADSVANIPLLGRLFGVSDDTTTASFNIAAYGRELGRDQVIPMLGQGMCHWGFWAAPVYSLVVTVLALWLDRRTAREDRPEMIFIGYLVLGRLAAGPVLGNWTIVVGILATIWIPLMAVLALNRKWVWAGRSRPIR